MKKALCEKIGTVFSALREGGYPFRPHQVILVTVQDDNIPRADGAEVMAKFEDAADLEALTVGTDEGLHFELMRGPVTNDDLLDIDVMDKPVIYNTEAKGFLGAVFVVAADKKQAVNALLDAGYCDNPNEFAYYGRILLLVAEQARRRGLVLDELVAHDQAHGLYDEPHPQHS